MASVQCNAASGIQIQQTVMQLGCTPCVYTYTEAKHSRWDQCGINTVNNIIIRKLLCVALLSVYHIMNGFIFIIDEVRFWFIFLPSLIKKER